MATYDKSITQTRQQTKTPEQSHTMAMQIVSYLGFIAAVILFAMELFFGLSLLHTNNITIYQCISQHLQTTVAYTGLTLFTFLSMLVSLEIFEKYSFKARMLDEKNN